MLTSSLPWTTISFTLSRGQNQRRLFQADASTRLVDLAGMIWAPCERESPESTHRPPYHFGTFSWARLSAVVLPLLGPVGLASTGTDIAGARGEQHRQSLSCPLTLSGSGWVVLLVNLRVRVVPFVGLGFDILFFRVLIDLLH